MCDSGSGFKTPDITVGADGELRLGGDDAPEDQRSARGLGRTGRRNIRHSVQGTLFFQVSTVAETSVAET